MNFDTSEADQFEPVWVAHEESTSNAAGCAFSAL